MSTFVQYLGQGTLGCFSLSRLPLGASTASQTSLLTLATYSHRNWHSLHSNKLYFCAWDTEIKRTVHCVEQTPVLLVTFRARTCKKKMAPPKSWSQVSSLLDKFSEKPLKIMWKVPGIFHYIFMGCYPWISPENFKFQRPWKWEAYEIPMKGCKI